MKREANWPRYMTAKALVNGAMAYYWAPRTKDRSDGCMMESEALGASFADAVARADFLNTHLDAWRDGKDIPAKFKDEHRKGTIDWWHHTYFAHQAFKKLSSRSQDDYRNALARIADVPIKLTDARTGKPARTGTLMAASLSPQAVDKIYDKLRRDGAVNRQANYAIDVARRAWNVVSRLHPGLFLVPVVGKDGKVNTLAINPFEGVIRTNYERDTAVPATRAQALTFAKVATEAGHPALGVAALICFEWHQRPEDVRKGRITWTGYRPADKSNKVHIFHHKTRKRVWKLLDATVRGRAVEWTIRRLYPELDEAIAALPKLGVPMIMFVPERGPKDEFGRRIPRLYSEPHAQHLVQKIREAAKLPAHFTLEACRHGGMTELGDAELTEQEIMTLSTHATPEAARLYVKRNERQELSAATKRRDYVEGKRTKRG